MEIITKIVVALAFAALVFSILAIFSHLSMFRTVGLASAIAKDSKDISINVGWDLAIAVFSTFIIALYFL
jgi:hypothetical protein